MNIKKISFPLNILIFGLLFTSSFPALTLSENFEQINTNFVENIGNEPVVLYVVAASAVGLPTTINK